MDSSPPVKKSVIDPPTLAADLRAGGEMAGFRVEAFGEVAGCPLLGLGKRTSGARPRVYLSAGIHGDEPAGPLALLQLLQDKFFAGLANWVICPMLNPSGLLRGVRENARGADLNRDYRGMVEYETQCHVKWLQRQPNFDLTLCLHEDWESKGFYLYELNPRLQPACAEAIVTAAAQYMPIEAAGMIDGREALVPGIIRPEDNFQERERWPEAIYLHIHHTRLGYTLETPSALPLLTRIATQVACVQAAIRALATVSARA